MFFERHIFTSLVNTTIYVTKGATIYYENLEFTRVIKERDIGN